MSDTLPAHTPPTVAASDERTVPAIIYGLYLGGFLTGGVSTLVGFLMACALRSEATPLQQSHYEFQIRTIAIFAACFIIAVGVILAGFPLAIVLVGILFWIAGGLMISALGIWFAVRSGLGLARILQGQEYPQPRTYFI
jgi:uncharacterized membrane protein